MVVTHPRAQSALPSTAVPLPLPTIVGRRYASLRKSTPQPLFTGRRLARASASSATFFFMNYRTLAIALLSTSIGVAVVNATSAISALRFEAPAMTVDVPPGSVKATVAEVVDTPRGQVVLLETNAQHDALPIWVGSAEARAIARAHHGVHTVRPMTHDLFATSLDDLDVKIAYVRVDRLRSDGVYIGTVVLVSGSEVREIDARPSDAISLALRTDAPIYVDQDLAPHFVNLGTE